MAVTDDDVEVLDTDEAGTDAFAAYFAEANKVCDREVDYSNNNVHLDSGSRADSTYFIEVVCIGSGLCFSANMFLHIICSLGSVRVSASFSNKRNKSL